MIADQKLQAMMSHQAEHTATQAMTTPEADAGAAAVLAAALRERQMLRVHGSITAAAVHHILLYYTCIHTSSQSGVGALSVMLGNEIVISSVI